MKLYEVYSRDYDSYRGHGIFSTREKAQAYVNKHFERLDGVPYETIGTYDDGSKFGLDEVDIREWELDEGIMDEIHAQD
jgi:hypothetical protein